MQKTPASHLTDRSLFYGLDKSANAFGTVAKSTPTVPQQKGFSVG